MTRAYHQSRPPRRFALLVALALVVTGLPVLGPVGPAGAAVGETQTETWNDTVVDGSCGFRTTLTTTGTLIRTIKPATGQGDGFPLITEKISYRDTYADPGSGDELFTVRGDFQFKMNKAKPLGDGLYEVTAKDSGLMMVVEDSTGRQRGHDSGAVTYKFVADHDGNFVEFLGARSPGPERKSKCAIVGSFLGSDSASRLTAHPFGTTDSPLGYYEYLPPGYDADGAKSPLLLFFHGYGGSGDGSAEQLPLVINDTAIPLYISTNNWPSDRPFVVLAPQHNAIEDPDDPSNCQDPYGGTCVMERQNELGNPPDNSPCTRPEEVEAILNYAVAHYNVDTSRIYLTGLSCGAYGVWEALPRLGARVAAAVPIAGNGEPSFGSTDCKQWVSPIWAFHGDADDVVRQDGSTDTIQGLRRCAPQPSEDLRLTIYPGVDHNSWDRAYTGTGENEDVFNWMLGYTSG